MLRDLVLPLTGAVLLGAAVAAPVAAEELGEALFNQRCAACHQPGGVGTPGLAPPLVNSQLWPALGDKATTYFWGVLNNGMSGTIEVDGIGYYGLVMPVQADLSAAQMKSLAQYILHDLNGVKVTLDDAVLDKARTVPAAHTELRSLRKNGQ